MPCHAASVATASELEEIVVTGTRIARPAFESASPIVAIEGDVFRRTSAVGAESTLARLPQFVPRSNGTSNDPGNDGQANVSLRGLGVAQTLVLLDGKRLMHADGSGSPDLNVVPPALIESVEIVTGGASAVYGSDAIAGVVNFKLRDSLDGIEVAANWGRTEQGDGDEYSIDVTAGTTFATGRGSLIAYFGRAERTQINQGDRDFSRYPLAYYAGETAGQGPGGAFLPSGSAITPEGFTPVFANPEAFRTVFAQYGYPPGTVPYWPAVGFNADGTLFMPGDNVTPGSFVNFRGVIEPGMWNDRFYSVNYSATTALQMPLERTSVFLRSRFDLSESHEIYAQALYADYEVTRQLAPVGANVMLVPPTNPYLPDDLRVLLASRSPDPNAPFRFLKMMTDIGPRTAQNDRDLLQVTAGVRGGLGESWRYDIYAQHGRNERTEKQTGNMRISRFQDLVFAPDGGRSICGDFNPFGLRPLSPACVDYIATDARHEISLEQFIAEAAISGPLVRLPAGDLRAVLGLFHKNEDFRFDADEVSSAYLPAVPGFFGQRPDITGFPGSPDRRGEVRNTDLYVEALVPLLPDPTGLSVLDLGVGYRYSEYSQSGGVHSYKGELIWKTLDVLRLRGSFQHAVRAPSIEELYYPLLPDQFFIQAPEPCSTNSSERNGPYRAQVEALCVAQGLPADRLPTFIYNLFRVGGVTGGNPDLKAEAGDTTTVGLVFTTELDRPGTQRLQLSLDWYRIDLADAIDRRDPEIAVPRCYDVAYNPDFRLDNGYCQFFRRDPESGEIFAEITNRNVGGLVTSGIDLEIDASIDWLAGEFRVNAYVTYVDRWQVVEPSGATTDYAGTIGGRTLGGSIPRVKSLFTAGYVWNALDTFVRWRYIDSMRDYREADFSVPSRSYFDLGAAYALDHGVLDGLTVGAGIENIADEQPPIFPSWQQANTDPSQYDVIGRRYYVTLQYRF